MISTKLYTVNDYKKIVGTCLNGPLTTPINLDINDVITMVNSGYEIYQHNPIKLSEKVRVTKDNINNITFEPTHSILKKRQVIKEEKEMKEFPVAKQENHNDGGNNQSNKFNKKNKHEKFNNSNKGDNVKNDEPKTEKLTSPDTFEI